MYPVFYIDPHAKGSCNGLTPENAFLALPLVLVVGARYVFLSEIQPL